MVIAMTSWQQTGDVITLISDWLTTSLNEAMTQSINRVQGSDEVLNNHKKTRSKVYTYSGGPL